MTRRLLVELCKSSPNKPPQSFILQLPVELCEKVVCDNELSRQDLRSLRLTHPAFDAIARPLLLYGRVFLSRLIKDRDEFEEVADSHGRYVKEVIWRGLDFESWVQSPCLWAYIMGQAHPSGVLESVVRDANLLWIPIRYSFQANVHDEQVDSTYKEMRRASADWISKQIEYMPNITTLTIRPMPDSRAFGKTIETIKPQYDYRQHRQGHDYEPIDTNHLNGEFDFVVALSALRRPKCKVRTLNLDTTFRRPDIWDARLQDAQTFQHLTTINICCTPRGSMGVVASGTLLHCLQRAENLRSLKLCFSHVPGKKYFCYLPDSPEYFLRELFEQTSWPHLHSLHIVNVRYRNIVAPLPGLRHLTLDDCFMRYDWFENIRTQRVYPHLESITIRAYQNSGETKRPVQIASEARMLAFLRNEVADLDPNVIYHDGEIITDTKVPLCQLCSPPQTRKEGFRYKFE
ncbi:hypothetical protein F4782DRAFT_528879 [Xylaria castorea]|nr:hypothetical protein F4782DRAFT_528879 [Xylaria castorea]